MSSCIVCRCHSGIIELLFSQADELLPAYAYETVTRTHLTDRPTLMDIYDKKYVYIADSSIHEVQGEVKSEKMEAYGQIGDVPTLTDLEPIFARIPTGLPGLQYCKHLG